jgi:hypothetical protein
MLSAQLRNYSSKRLCSSGALFLQLGLMACASFRQRPRAIIAACGKTGELFLEPLLDKLINR